MLPIISLLLPKGGDGACKQILSRALKDVWLLLLKQENGCTVVTVYDTVALTVYNTVASTTSTFLPVERRQSFIGQWVREILL